MVLDVERAHIASVLLIISCPYAASDEIIVTNNTIMKSFVFMTRASCDV
jgi:hypothetical protein